MRHGVRGHGDNRQIFKSGLSTQGARRRETIHDRHLDVHQHQIKRIRAGLGEQIKRFLTIANHARRDANKIEQGVDNFAVERLVFNHQHAGIGVAGRGASVTRITGSRQIFGLANAQPERHAEDTALTKGATDADPATHHFAQSLADRQP